MAIPVFISYRREDSIAEAGRLYTTLIHEFGEGTVFMDTSNIEPGSKWFEDPENTEECQSSSCGDWP